MPLDKFLPVDPDENNIAAGVFSLKTGKFIKLLFNSLLSTNIFLFSQFISILFCITFKLSIFSPINLEGEVSSKI